ncbi:adenosylcobinamide-GDP ribazoletransferase [Marinitenerispora sediminis]|uniref:Adenosylcobinamide-GDP ribazoletransferase n=1 Tax=Marinitenerispora sediminis TaxID=1931232 RepID=A0A368T3J9_9ACTN|nr:adenosylcobinamide-GDP ribazoletransferase [Marinitenerispora sediminis]RCV52050.1 adenosylcobinamide-GDP ribazoletransferase [Marinitenerispora sediminis]RCV54121.1 adenosylcobinamide-GDP ribazoletransferase [Marinitenerispora sediminis]RCV54362.1 adenosylcobinamide-GDP ribazoletransferase [Marinitenerispora sediminis]
MTAVLAAALAGLRLSVGTLTVFPVHVTRVDRTAAGWAMALAPLVGLPLALAGGLALASAVWAGLPVHLAAVLAVAALALLTRGLHLDGLADLADGLGSARPAEGALEVMRRSDIGPFGVITLVLTLLAQVLALAHLAAEGPATAVAALATAALTGRLAITWSCTPAIPPARPEGLGALVAGTVPRSAALAATLAVLPLGLASPGLLAALAAGLAVAALVLRHAVRRLGGITGDVLGALSETATTVTLVTATATMQWGGIPA